MGFWEITQLLQEKLLIELPPVALAFVQEPPPDVLVMGKDPPSFCSLWRWGESALFYTTPEQHLGCLVGGMVAGYPVSAAQMEEVRALIEEMCSAEDLPPEKVEDISRITRPWAGVVYGPLWRFPMQPDLVVFWANIVQAAVLQEITGPLMWRGNPQGAVFPRPACSVLAMALAHQKPALSQGCVGMRAYTQIPADQCLLAVPGSILAKMEQELPTIADPEARMQVYYDRMEAAQAQQRQS